MTLLIKERIKKNKIGEIADKIEERISRGNVCCWTVMRLIVARRHPLPCWGGEGREVKGGKRLGN